MHKHYCNLTTLLLQLHEVASFFTVWLFYAITLDCLSLTKLYTESCGQSNSASWLINKKEYSKSYPHCYFFSEWLHKSTVTNCMCSLVLSLVTVMYVLVHVECNRDLKLQSALVIGASLSGPHISEPPT